jgi:hypothetical protein
LWNMAAVTENDAERNVESDVNEDDVKVLKTDELFRRLTDAIRAVPMFDPADRAAWHRAWDKVRLYHDELGARYPRNGTPAKGTRSSATP